MCRMILCCLAALMAGSGVAAGPALDNIVNAMRLDQTASSLDLKATISVTREQPVGVSFVTGPKTVKLCRIAVGCMGWGGSSWAPDESLVLTLWDSEKKQTKIAEYAMPYKFRKWEGTAMMFPLWVDVKPDSRYYFELTVSGGDSRIDQLYLSRRGYPNGKMYVGGAPRDDCVWFETHVQYEFGKDSRDAAYAEQFANWNLDYPGFEKLKAAVQANDWDAACNQLTAWYESQEKFCSADARKIKKSPKFDKRKADLAVNQQSVDANDKPVDIGPDWNYFSWWEDRGGVGLTRTGLMQPLAAGYRNTHDEKYAAAYNDMILAMLRDLPSPLKSGVIKPGAKDIACAPPAGIAGGSMWSGLSLAARAGQALYWYATFAGSPSFTQDARTAVLFSMVDMINVLAIQKGGGNWETQMKSGLFDFAYDHPEFARSKEWLNEGKDGLFANLKIAIQPDGALEEPTPNYHALSVNRFLGALQTCRDAKLDVPNFADRLTEKGLDWLMYITQGNGVIPAWGDTWQPMTCYLYKAGYDYFKRPDYLWMLTNGKEGQAPLETSKAFSNGGWYVMRTGWGKDDLFLMTQNGPFGGHGHNDRLAICAYAYGSELLIDPGIYVYGTPEAEEISKTRHHSTVTVDDLDTVKNGKANRMVMMPSFDYYAGTNAGYLKGHGERHTRKIMFLKPSYWLMQDAVTGTGTHAIDSRFEFPRCEAEVTGLTARTLNRTGGNIEVAMVGGGQGFTLSKDEGEICLQEKLYPIPVARFSKQAELPVSWTTLLYPYPASRGSDAKATELQPDSAPILGCSATAVQTKSGTDYVTFGAPGTPVSASGGKITLDGEALAVRTDSGLRSVFLVDGTSASLNGKQLISSEKPCSVSVEYSGDTMRVSAVQNEPTLTVFTGTARYCVARVGSRLVVEPGSYVKPFAPDNARQAREENAFHTVSVR